MAFGCRIELPAAESLETELGEAKKERVKEGVNN